MYQNLSCNDSKPNSKQILSLEVPLIAPVITKAKKTTKALL